MSPAPPPPSRARIRPWLVVGDLALAAAWVCAGALVKPGFNFPTGPA